jgi:uncharacterized protein
MARGGGGRVLRRALAADRRGRAAYYRERKVAAVVFTVDAEKVTGRRAVPNEVIAEVAAAHPDVLIPFASLDPNKGARAGEEARRLVRDYDVTGFKFHPNVQAFYPNDRTFYPPYEVVAEAGVPALIHTGHSGIGTGLPGGGASGSSIRTRCMWTTSLSTFKT